MMTLLDQFEDPEVAETVCCIVTDQLLRDPEMM